MHTSLGPGDQRLLRDKRRKLDTLLFFFNLLVNIVPSLIEMTFFYLWVRFSSEVFSYCAFCETFGSGFKNWFELELFHFWDFVGSRLASSSWYLHWLWSEKIAQLGLSFDDLKSFRYSVWGVLWSFFAKCARNFQPLYFLISNDVLYQCNSTQLLMLVRLSASFCKSWGKHLWLHLNPNLPLSCFFFNVDCPWMFYSTPRSSFFWRITMEPITALSRWWPCWRRNYVLGPRRV